MELQKMTNNIFELTESIIKKTGPRLTGSQACLESGVLLKDEIGKYSDHVELEEFTVHTGAFLGWIQILVIGYLLSCVFLWLSIPLVSLILSLISVLVLVLQFFLYKHFIDKLWPKKTAANVVGYVEPLEEVKNTVIVSGHHDSANIFNFFIHQPKLYGLRTTGSIGFVFLMMIVSIVFIFIPIPLLKTILSIIMSLGFLLIGQMWFFKNKKATPGAGDNLISSSLAVEIGKHYSQNKLKNTRLLITSFDAEEEGLRGAYAFAKKHEEDFKKTPTYLLNIDCPYYLKDLFFLTSDINGSVKMSIGLAEQLVSIAKEKGYPAKHQPIAFLTGGTDAGELAKKGVIATTLMAMPWTNNVRSHVYHTPKDTIDAVEPASISAIVDIYTAFINKLDMQ